MNQLLIKVTANLAGQTFMARKAHAGNFSYPSSAAAVVSGGHLSARAVFRLDRKPQAIRP